MIKSAIKHLLLICTIVSATYVYGQDIIMTVSGVDASQGGRVSAGLYNSADGWTKPGSQVAGARTEVNGQSTVDIVFSNVPPGKYALAIMHDANSNDEMDTNFVGFPKEGYSFSNNVFGRLGPPKFDDASFLVIEGRPTNVTATMKY